MARFNLLMRTIYMAVVFLGFSCFKTAQSAAVPIIPMQPTKQITIATTPNFTGEHQFTIQIADINYKTVAPLIESRPNLLETRQLPIKRVIVTSSSENYHGGPVSKLSLSPEDVEKLSLITINNNGKLSATYENPAEITVAPKQTPAPIKTKEAVLVATADYRDQNQFDIFFYDIRNDSVTNPITINPDFIGQRVSLPIQNIKIIAVARKTTKTSSILELSAVDIENLSLITIDGKGQLKAVFAESGQPTVVFAKPSIPPSASLITQLFEKADRSDVEGFRKLLPEINTTGIIDQTDEAGITALGHTIIQLRNNLELLHDLMANGADLNKKDKAGQSQIELAGPQKDILLKLLGVTSGEECPVCMEPKKLAKLPACGHAMCKECLNEILQKKEELHLCPLCRKPFEKLKATK